ncbi:MAG: metallophosphoesterase [Clostridia bacterium]|nr:metallophosphoesterase [Clostridia bacterium]
MKVFFKKPAAIIVVLALLIVATLALSLPAMAAEPESFYGVNVSTSGTVSLNFFYTSLGEADSVCVIERDASGAEVSKETVSASALPTDSEGRVVVSAKLAAAEMTNFVTVYTQKNGEKLGSSHTYSVQSYAEQVLERESLSSYHAAIRAMLNYGAMAQAHFGTNASSLANANLYRGNTNPVNAVTDINCAASSWSDATTLTFKGYEAVLESSTAFKIYFAYTGSGSLSATVERDGISAQKSSVYLDSAKGLYYVKINNIAAMLYNKQYTVKVSDGSDNLSVTASVLNYADTVLTSETASATQKNAVRALYNYYVWTADAAPAFTDCEHAYTHQETADKNSATAYVCSTCGLEIKNVSDKVELFRSPMEILSSYTSGWSQTGELMTDSDGTVFARIHGGSSIEDKYNTLYVYGNGKETGRYLILKYRLPSDNPTAQPNIYWYSKSNAAGSTWANTTIVASQDDKWHTIVVDLDQVTSDTNGFMPNVDGKYYAHTVWFRPLSWTKQGTVEDSMDIAYIAMCNDLSDISALVDETKYERHNGGISSLVDTATNECEKHYVTETLTSEYCAHTCDICEQTLGKVTLKGVNYYCSAKQLADFGVTTSRPIGDHFSYSTTLCEEDGEVFARMTYNDEHYTQFGGTAGQIYAHGDYNNAPGKCDGSTGRFLVMKIRTTGKTTYTLNISSNGSALTNSSTRNPTSLGTSGKWETVIVDLSAYANYSVYDTSADAGVVCRITTGGSVIGEDYVDLAYFAIVDTVDEAQQLIGEDTYTYHGSKEAWATLGTACNTSTMSCKNGCTQKVNSVSCAGGKSYSYSCASCGHDYSARQFVPSDVNWFVSTQRIYDYYYAGYKTMMTDEDGTLFVRLNGGTTNAYNSLPLGNPGHSTPVGQYLVMKYRFRSDNPSDQSTQRIYMRSYNPTAGAVGSYTSPIWYTAHQDGEWHTIVIDMAKHPSAANYKADATDNLYYLDQIWLRPMSLNDKHNSTSEDYMDLAYVAMCDSIDDITKLVDQDTYEMHTSNTEFSVKDTKSGECVTHSYVESGSDNAYVYTCSICGYVADFDVDRFFPVSTMQKTEAFQITASVKVDPVTGASFMRYAGQGKAGQVNPYRFPIIIYGDNADGTQNVSTTYGKGTPFNIGKGDKYLVVKFRTNSTDWTQGMYLGTKDANTITLGSDGRYTGSPNRFYYGFPMSELKANEWQLLVLDMSSLLGQYWIGNSEGEYTIETLQFHSSNVPSGVYYDIEYYAFCDSWEDIAYLSGSDKAMLVEATNSGRWVNSDGSCTDGGCAVVEETTATAYKKYCTACGKIYEQKDISAINEFVSATQTSKFTTLYMPLAPELPTLVKEYDEATGEYLIYSRHTHNLKNEDGTPKNGEGHMYFFNGHVAYGLGKTEISSAGRYLVLKFRTFGVSKMILQARRDDNDYATSITRTTGFNCGWETMIVDLYDIPEYADGDSISTFTIRMKVFRAAAADPAHTVDVQYAAIVDTLDEALAVTGKGDVNLYEDWSKAPVTYTKTDIDCSGSVLGHTMAAATCTSARVCDVCGIEYTGAVGHTYSETVARKYLASRATDDTKAKFYKSCSCGAMSSETFEYGNTINEMVDYTKTDRFDAVANTITNGEKFLFFTDPHYVQAATDGVFNYSYEYAIDVMGKYFDESGVSFALSGGDWLNNSNTRENAIANLKDIDARMQAAFGKDFYLVVGNHDYNYQLWDADKSATVSSPHWLTREEIDDAWYTDERYGGKSYYSFKGENTTFYVFDSGIDWGHSEMDSFDIVQVEWFLSELAKNDDAHIALAPHILYTSGTNLLAATDKILEFSNVYNNRGAVTFNGKLYDFADKTGKVEFLIGGHSHRDEVAVYHNIPCVLTINNGSSCPSFDLVAVDYDAKVVHLTRVNAGTAANAQTLDRTVSLEAAAE